jgi:hypothetical protein
MAESMTAYWRHMPFKLYPRDYEIYITLLHANKEIALEFLFRKAEEFELLERNFVS